MPDYLIIAVICLYGIIIGSFLNVVIYRLPRRMGFGVSRSRCPKCGHLISWYENVPVISYLFLMGKCSACSNRISPRYPMVETLTAMAYLYLYSHYGLTVQFGVAVALVTALIVVFFIDLDFYIIPDVITYPGLAIGLAASFLPSGIGILQSLIGAVVGGGALYGVAALGYVLFKKESMGGGDIKLTAMLGAFLGWQNVVVIFILSAIIALIVSIGFMAASKRFRRTRMIPFGPFIAVAAVVAMTHGGDLVSLYVRTFVEK